MKLRGIVCFLALLVATQYAAAQDYTIETLAEPAPADEFSESIAAELAPEGYRVLRKGKPYLDVWFEKSIPAKEDFSPTLAILYPFEQGKLFGVIRYHRSAGDFRDQEIEEGVYTLRYALQPVDGNHVGTSDTRDFLLLSLAEDDTEADPVDGEELNLRSADAAQSAHPCMLSFLRTPDDATVEPKMLHDEDRDLWSIQVPVNTTAGDDKKVVTFVVVGYTEL